MASLSYTNRESIRRASVEGRGIRSRLIVDGRELFLTNVSGVKADIRLAVLRRRVRSYYCVNQSTFSTVALDARGDKVRRIKINAHSFFYSISTISISLSRARERWKRRGRITSVSDLLDYSYSDQGENRLEFRHASRANGDRLPFS